MRKLALPELVRCQSHDRFDFDWPILDDVYPARVAYVLEIDSHPDPFSPNTQRLAHRGVIHIGGMGSVDVGWYVTGESPQAAPWVQLFAEPLLLSYFADIHATAWERSPPERGLIQPTWASYVALARTTVACLAGHIACAERHPVLSRLREHFLAHGVFDSHGTAYGWEGVSPINLVTMDALAAM